MNTKTTLLFSNVAAECTENDLSQWIEARGYTVSSVRLIRDEVTGTSPSFAYVELSEADKLAEAAWVLDGRNLLGKRVRVLQTVPMQSAVQSGRKLRVSA